MISFESRARGQFGAGFSVKIDVIIHGRHLGGETWNHAGPKGCCTLGPAWGRIEQSKWDMWYSLSSGELDFSIRIILRGRVDFGVAFRRNEEAEARKICADKFV